MDRNGGPYTKKRFLAAEAPKRHAHGWSGRVVVRYVLLQVPALSVLILMLILVQRWVDLPSWLFWCLVGLWVAKDTILFPFTWRAYDWDRLRNANPMVGSRGSAEDRLAPSGYVRVHGELWQAEVMEDGPPVEKGQAVRVRGIRGLTLLVQPNNEQSD
jgi:membrane protein implicated in regulation of membrane protease activity